MGVTYTLSGTSFDFKKVWILEGHIQGWGREGGLRLYPYIGHKKMAYRNFRKKDEEKRKNKWKWVKGVKIYWSQKTGKTLLLETENNYFLKKNSPHFFIKLLLVAPVVCKCWFSLVYSAYFMQMWLPQTNNLHVNTKSRSLCVCGIVRVSVSPFGEGGRGMNSRKKIV